MLRPKSGQEQRKRRREWTLIVLSVILIGVFPFLKRLLFEQAAQIQISNNILVLALINLNILLVILFFFLIFRNILKLVLERRRNTPGAKLRTRLVATFVSLSLIPTLLLFFASAAFITNSIESWFSTEVEKSLSESLSV
ncbi:MAG: PAS domain-containing sensor histidine kinase, partial [Desulfuromonas sp.]|nr:PAS domain-containing sensor histidine kinase [Desulfuromonas sp.]